ncbi:unnamed protein product [Calypogeia fissa]
MGVEGRGVVGGRIPEQKTFGGLSFPEVLVPSDVSLRKAGAAVAEWVKENKEFINGVLHKSSAIVFRGFGVNSAADFNAFVEALGYPELPYVGGAAPRTNVVGRVFTSNESPPDQKIPFHHEMAQVPEYPAKVFFFCEVEAAEGGETPIVLSHRVYDRMATEWPEFVREIEEKGLIYNRVLGEGDDPSSPIGRGWQSTFLTKDRQEAEKKAAKLGMTLEWLDDGVKSVSGPLPAVKTDESRGRKVWFNSMVAAFTGWEDARNKPQEAVTFGDGKPLPKEAVLACLQILTEESVAIPWQKGDVFLLDNIAVQHARKAFVPPRRVLAALAK